MFTNVALLEKSVASKGEPRFVAKVLRQVSRWAQTNGLLGTPLSDLKKGKTQKEWDLRKCVRVCAQPNVFLDVERSLAREPLVKDAARADGGWMHLRGVNRLCRLRAHIRGAHG